MKLALTMTVLGALAMGGVAHADDHQELVCTGAVEATAKGERIPLFIHFFDARLGADDRMQTLSTIYQGKLFQASRAESVASTAITLKAGKQVRFLGRYIVHNTGAGPYTLELVGKLVVDPGAKKAAYRAVTATLQCVDLSS